MFAKLGYYAVLATGTRVTRLECWQGGENLVEMLLCACGRRTHGEGKQAELGREKKVAAGVWYR
jgi:hypothetical protein